MNANLASDALAMAARLRAIAGPRQPNTLDDAAELLERIAKRLSDCKTDGVLPYRQGRPRIGQTTRATRSEP